MSLAESHAVLGACVVGLLSAFLSSQTAADTRSIPVAHPSAGFQPAFRADGMVPLQGSKVLVWSSDGKVQAGSPSTGWGPPILLPLTYVTSAFPEPEGALIGGSEFPAGGNERSVALSLDANAGVRMRWYGGNGLFNSVASTQQGRWAIALNQLIELLPDGRVQPIHDVPSLSELVPAPTGVLALCKPANLTLAHRTQAECWTPATAKWQVPGSWKSRPVACGRWLVVAGRKTMVATDLSGGIEVSRRNVQADAIACGHRGSLLVGSTGVRALALPSLQDLWKAPCGRKRVLAIATTSEGVLCLDSEGNVRTVR